MRGILHPSGSAGGLFLSALVPQSVPACSAAGRRLENKKTAIAAAPRKRSFMLNPLAAPKRKDKYTLRRQIWLVSFQSLRCGLAWTLWEMRNPM
jgi:hypothetical protein